MKLIKNIVVAIQESANQTSTILSGERYALLDKMNANLNIIESNYDKPKEE